MVKKLFWEDPYADALDTVVDAVEGHLVFLRETIFYALSGGQESDSGTIGGYPVLEAKKTGLDIAYTLPEGHGLRPGDPVRIKIDRDRRYRLMRLHFAAELILEVAYRHLNPIEKHYWEIPGFARVSCGGTHLKTTGEIGPIALKRKNIGKGKERIEVYAAEPS